MIAPNEYFEKYLSWKRSDSGLRSAKATYAPFTVLDLESLTAEARPVLPAHRRSWASAISSASVN